MYSRNGFTLIELLVVIAIIAVLAVVVVLTLNPAGLLQEARDSNRISDMATLNNVINIFSADTPTLNALGSANTVYVSIPDSSATSTAGDQCQGLRLPSLPSGWSYQCAASSTYRLTNGTGWVPVNFSSATFGVPISVLPTDPVNTTSTNLYYTYVTANGKWQLTAQFEAPKSMAMKPNSGGSDPALYTTGSNLSLAPFVGGMVGWWPFTEGSGTTAFDLSGWGNNGTWIGTPTGTSGYYSAGKTGTWAGAFDGVTDYLTMIDSAASSTLDTVSFWLFAKAVNSVPLNVGTFNYYLSNLSCSGINNTGNIYGTSFPYSNQWVFVTVILRNGNYMSNGSALYYNGVPQVNTCGSGTPNANLSSTVEIGQFITGNFFFQGFMNDVRIYNRALSASEISAIYNAEK